MIEIPPDVRWLGWLVGIDPPQGDEDALFAISAAWHEAAKVIAAQIDPLAAVQRDAMGAYTAGSGAETIGALFDTLLHGTGSLDALATAFDEIGDAAFDFGTTVQQAKLMMILSYALLAVEIAWAWMFPPTAPALEAAAVNGTRSSLRLLEDLAIDTIERAILRVAGAVGQRSWARLVVKNLSTYAVKGAVSGAQAAVLDLAVQGGQLAGGTRRSLNGNEVLLSFGSSYLGSLTGRAAGHWGGIGFDASIGRLTNSLGPAASVFRGAAVGTFGGVVSTAGGAVGSAMNSGDWHGAFSGTGLGSAMTGGPLRGAVAGGSRGLFQLNRIPDSPSRTGFLRHFQVDAEGNVYAPASRAAAAGGTPSTEGPQRPVPVERPAIDRSAPFSAHERRRLRALDRQDAANLREYQRELRLRQPQLRAQPTDPTADAPRTTGDRTGRVSGEREPPEQLRPRARALGEPSGSESVDRQPPWSSRMSGRAHAMQQRAEVAQERADIAQTGADAAQGRATTQQTRATTAQEAVATAKSAVVDARRQVDDARNQLAQQRAADNPDPRLLESAEAEVVRAQARRTRVGDELETAVERASQQQRLADRLQTRADDLQRVADSAQSRADDLRMVRVSREAINRKADGEATTIVPPGADENTWWKRALMRSERLGKKYGTGGPGADHHQSKGTDLRGKTRPKLDMYHAPKISPYVAPAAPDPSEWGTPPPVSPPPEGDGGGCRHEGCDGDGCRHGDGCDHRGCHEEGCDGDHDGCDGGTGCERGIRTSC
ncbi:hypothetical protein [Nocardia sp. NPDC005366]|uniref:WXG100-like domain-containing protein n=1 Tax=Nocardia sp. NPDC005366 TaxID=3156878 RepID=UPI0033AFB0E1